MFNHTVPEKTWNVFLQENHINATRGIIKTAMAYALFQEEEFNDDNVVVDPRGRAGFVVNPDTVTDKDENGAGHAAGPEAATAWARTASPSQQRPYEVIEHEVVHRHEPAHAAAVLRRCAAARRRAQTGVRSTRSTRSCSPTTRCPPTRSGRRVDASAYFANLKAWVQRGGNLVLTDRALHALADLGVVPKDAITDIQVYQPFANFTTSTTR